MRAKTDRSNPGVIARFMPFRPEAGRRLPEEKLRVLRMLTTQGTDRGICQRSCHPCCVSGGAFFAAAHGASAASFLHGGFVGPRVITARIGSLFDKDQQRVTHAAITGNERLGEVLSCAMALQQAAAPNMPPAGKQRSRCEPAGKKPPGRKRWFGKRADGAPLKRRHITRPNEWGDTKSPFLCAGCCSQSGILRGCGSRS